MKQEKFGRDVAIRLKSCCARRVVMGNESDKFRAQARHGCCPFCDFVRIDLQKDSFAVNFDGWQPINLLVELESLEAVAGQVAIGRKNSGETSEGTGFAELVDKPDARKEFCYVRLVIRELRTFNVEFALRANLPVADGLVFGTAEIFLISGGAGCARRNTALEFAFSGNCKFGGIHASNTCHGLTDNRINFPAHSSLLEKRPEMRLFQHGSYISADFLRPKW